ncbi:alpha/beta hydrolase [Sphingomonas ginkgonis]|uniref:Alpha/beta hydrolase n=1 Tax=Sphingomonas ginkgonis TaxID=2315330 RepID=A0A3R9WU28_9SPHN|nr:alpha/beta hydrolase [Sphingomonas ginkgonis]RST31829.1 alpha/beta hydrolase [Sphingomonas ginkgonis]
MAAFEDRYFNSPDGLRLHYRDYAGPADGPPIICLPGLTRNARDFEPVAERFAGEWRIIALDFRGRGESEHDPRPERYLPPVYAKDILKLLDQLGIAEAVFFGTSLGGLVTMLLAATDEERIAGALINDVGPELSLPGLDRIRSYVGEAASWPSWEEATRDLAGRHADVFPNYDLSGWDRHARRLCREDKSGRISFDYDPGISEPFKLANDAPQPDLWPLLYGLKGKPVLVLRGDRSDLFTAETAERMAETIGSAELVTVKDVGHAPALDEPEAVAAMERLLARVRSASA